MPEWLIQILQLVVVPIVIGILTSLLFLLLISRIRPNLQISTKISRFESTKYSNKHGYAVKVINKSRRPAVEMKARLAIVQEKIVPGGAIERTTDFKLEKDSRLEMPGFDKKAPETCSFRFITYDDIDAKWKDDKSHLLFVIYAKDSLTGFGKLFEQKYYLKRESIKDGSFKKGIEMEIA